MRISIITAAIVCTALADPPLLSTQDAKDYDSGQYGDYPTFELKSKDQDVPRLLRRQWTEEACMIEGEYYFVAPHSSWISHAGPSIFDTAGHQVWFGDGYPTTYNLQTQEYRGETYLTWWDGNNIWRDHGKGYYYMMNKNYQITHKLHAIGLSMDADLHDFTITPSNTALFTIYHTTPYDIHAAGVSTDHNEVNTTYINDSLFQEIDVETNKLLFRWRASDHVPLTDSYNTPEWSKGESFENAWDWFHINSVQKDQAGNYLISSRYTHSLYYLDGHTGSILWQLGGRHSNFTDLSGGKASNFARQHHARWVDELPNRSGSGTITLFDNGNEGPRPPWRSRGLHLAIDTTAMTVQLIADAFHPHNYTSVSQGSAQKTSNGNLLVGWGNTGAWTEFSADGSDVLCDWQFSALFTGQNGTWNPGAIESYRVTRSPWKGYPLISPDVAFHGPPRESVLYVSWNGATELRWWRLEGTRPGAGGEWVEVALFQRSGFESNITVNRLEYETFKVTALDKTSGNLGSWIVRRKGTIEPLPTGELDASSTPPPADTTTTRKRNFTSPTVILFILSIILLAILSLLIWLSRTNHHRRQFPHLHLHIPFQQKPCTCSSSPIRWRSSRMDPLASLLPSTVKGWRKSWSLPVKGTGKSCCQAWDGEDSPMRRKSWYNPWMREASVDDGREFGGNMYDGGSEGRDDDVMASDDDLDGYGGRRRSSLVVGHVGDA